MATSGTVVTLEEIVGTTTAMRVKLKKKSESLADQKLSGSVGNGSKQDDSEDELENLTEALVKGLVKKTKAEIEKAQADVRDLHNLDEKAKQEALKKNQELFDAITEKTVRRVRRIGQKMKEEMVNLPPDVQPQVITFWESAQDFFSGVLDWLSSMFNYVLEKIRQGFRLVKDAIKGLFDTVCRFLGNIF